MRGNLSQGNPYTIRTWVDQFESDKNNLQTLQLQIFSKIASNHKELIQEIRQNDTKNKQILWQILIQIRGKNKSNNQSFPNLSTSYCSPQLHFSGLLNRFLFLANEDQQILNKIPSQNDQNKLIKDLILRLIKIKKEFKEQLSYQNIFVFILFIAKNLQQLKKQAQQKKSALLTGMCLLCFKNQIKQPIQKIYPKYYSMFCQNSSLQSAYYYNYLRIQSKKMMQKHLTQFQNFKQYVNYFDSIQRAMNSEVSFTQNMQGQQKKNYVESISYCLLVKFHFCKVKKQVREWQMYLVGLFFYILKNNNNQVFYQDTIMTPKFQILQQDVQKVLKQIEHDTQIFNKKLL